MTFFDQKINNSRSFNKETAPLGGDSTRSSFTYPLKGRASIEPPWEKWGKIIVALLISVVFLPVSLGIYFYGRHIKSQAAKQLDPVRKEIEHAQIQKMAEALEIGLTGDKKGKKGKGATINDCDLQNLSQGKLKDTQAYYQKAFAIKELLEKHKNSKALPVGTAHAIYRQVQILLGQDSNSVEAKTYNQLKDEEDPVVQFLRYVAFKFRMADGESILKEHHQTVDPNQETSFTVEKIAQSAGKILTKDGVFHRDGKLSSVIWATQHLGEGLNQSYTSQYSPLVYNPHGHNPTFVVSQGIYTTQKGKKIPYCLPAGATPANDAAYREGFLKVVPELRFNNMDSDKTYERHYITNVHDAMQGTSSQQVVLGFDAKFKTPFLKSALKEAKTPGAFLAKYKEFLLNSASRKLDQKGEGNGVYLPEELLSNEQIQKAFSLTQDLLGDEMDKDVSPLKEKERKQQLKSFVALVDTMLMLGMTVAYLEKQAPPDTELDPDLKQVAISIACKQCYDRGPVYLALFLIYWRSLTDSSPLKEDEYRKIAALFERSNIGEDRTSLLKRFVIFSGAAHLLSNKMDKLSSLTQSYRQVILSPNPQDA